MCEAYQHLSYSIHYILINVGVRHTCPYLKIQLMPALAVNIIIVHPWDVVFPRANCSPEGEQLWCSPQVQALKLFYYTGTRCKKNLLNANISVNEQPEWFHWAHQRWPFYTYLHHVHVLDHGHFTDIVSALAI